VALVAIIGCGEGKKKTPDAGGDTPTAATSTVKLSFQADTLK
jgi:hypothetical protein